MDALDVAISSLSDERAVELLARFVRATRNAPPPPGTELLRGQAIGMRLSLAESAAEPPTAGALARAALLTLAGDPRHRNAVAALVADPGPRSFARAKPSLAASDVLDVLELQLQALPPIAQSPAIAYDTNAQPGLIRALAQQLFAYAAFRPAGPKSDAKYRVWYATTRRPLDSADPAAGFGVEHDDRVHYGSCRVFVPRSHRIGSVGSPWWKRVVTLSDDRLRLLAIEHAGKDSFWAGVREHLASCADEDRDAVVFVHGFNVDFEQAALRAAQLGFDLQIKGAMAFFSWASRGSIDRYPADEAAVELDEDEIADYLCEFASHTGARRVHVIAHSMGNRAVLRAVSRIARDAQQRTRLPFGQFILAAADVDARKFRQLCAAYRAISQRTTLYVSARDLAVETSRWLHDFPRAGLMPPVTVAEGIDTVNVVNADVSLLGHGYVAEARDVVSDIHALIRHGSEPQQRFGLKPVVTERGEPYWLIGA